MSSGIKILTNPLATLYLWVQKYNKAGMKKKTSGASRTHTTETDGKHNDNIVICVNKLSSF